MNTITVIRKPELFGVFSKYKLILNNQNIEVFYKKNIYNLPDGKYHLSVEKYPFESNQISINLKENSNVKVFIKGSPAGKYGTELSLIVIVCGIVFAFLEWVINYNYSFYFLLPLLAYMLMPIYTSILQKDKNRINIYTKNS